MVYMIVSCSISTLEGVKTLDLKTLSTLVTFQQLPHLDRHAKFGSVMVHLLLSLSFPQIHMSLQ